MTSYSVLSDREAEDLTELERVTEDFTHGAARMLLDLAHITDANGKLTEADAFAEAWHSPAYGWELDAFTDTARARIEERCAAFVADNLADIQAAAEFGYYAAHYGAYAVGQDYVLTANHHGVGYWDRGLGDLGDHLAMAAQADGAFSAIHSEDATEAELLEG